MWTARSECENLHAACRSKLPLRPGTMPELPEVETIRRDLDAAIVARRIVDVAVLDPKLVHGTVPERFRERLIGARLRGTARRGKSLVLRLDRGLLVLHLLMSGRPNPPPGRGSGRGAGA